MKKEKDLKDMTPSEKKQFLSEDLIERMIRVEQKVSSQFNKELAYNETEYYKSLTPKEKDRFKKHLKKKKKKKWWKFFILGISITLLIFLKSNISGNIIKEELAIEASLIQTIILILVGVAFISMVAKFISKKSKEKVYKRHLSVIDRISLKKSSGKF
jgi:hypothetical protein